MIKIDWNNLYKIRLASSDKSFIKHEVIKLLLVMRILDNHKRDKTWVRIYTEFELDNGLRTDVYYEHAKKKEAIAFEIQKDYSPSWLKDRAEKYKEWSVPYFNSSDWIPIPLKDFPDDLEGIYNKLGEYVV